MLSMLCFLLIISQYNTIKVKEEWSMNKTQRPEYAPKSFILQSWTDYRLIWDPKHYNGITRITLNFDMIWTPNTLLSRT